MTDEWITERRAVALERYWAATNPRDERLAQDFIDLADEALKRGAEITALESDVQFIASESQTHGNQLATARGLLEKVRNEAYEFGDISVDTIRELDAFNAGITP